MICLVTDRRRLAAAVGARQGDAIEVLREQVGAAAAAGVDLIQVREPDLDGGALTALVRCLIEVTRDAPAKLLVNDRVDVAIVSGASGVHLKEAGFHPAAVRRAVPAGFVIGCSVHTTATAAERNTADFLIAGTVLPTASKHPVEYLDQEGLSRIVAAAAGQPVLGIGGLDVRSVPLIVASGAAGLAAVGAFIPDRHERVTDFVQKRVTELRFALESASRGT
jgi:thiamine-phosphate pyrophosphorylase